MKREEGLATVQKCFFFTNDHDLRDPIMKVSRREIWLRTTESVKRQPFMTQVAKTSMTFTSHEIIQFYKVVT